MHLRSGLIVAALLIASCTAPPKPVELVSAPVLPLALDNDFEFRKVKRFLNQPETFQPTQNEVINFERSRANFGALSADERQQRQGTYFDVFWRARRSADLTVLDRLPHFPSLALPPPSRRKQQDAAEGHRRTPTPPLAWPLSADLRKKKKKAKQIRTAVAQKCQNESN